MKQFRKNEQGLFICEVCRKTYFSKNNGLCHHISKCHDKKEYYDKWLKDENEGLCKICGASTVFSGFRSDRGYEKCCCKKHLAEYLYQISVESNLEKYGVENRYQREDIKEKSKQTKKERYGNEYYLNRDKAKQTCLEHFGVENPLKSPKIILKIKQTVKEKYGVENVFQSEKIKEKCKQTSLKHFGVEYPSQNSEIHLKQQKSGFKLKQFKNTNIYYRGSYELDFLNKYYDKYPDITNAKSIKYIFEKKSHHYFPDFYIPSLNLIIEIKYSYYAKRDKNKIKAKEKAVIANGFKYIMIIDKNYDNFILPPFL
jgi:hypothetical protein